MATEHILNSGSDTIRILHDGSELVIGEGDDRVVQSFDDEDDAPTHLDSVLKRFRRDGWQLPIVKSRRSTARGTDCTPLPCVTSTSPAATASWP
ncbi:hypothetical protein [Nannocystis pusilla]|uniref:hypothetical protein n=1 Tax=Nannocystis pusilla TaxID=889268 RepID=UPI003B7615EE